MYLSKHISAERPHGFDTSPSYRGFTSKSYHGESGKSSRTVEHGQQMIVLIIKINSFIICCKFTTFLHLKPTSLLTFPLLQDLYRFHSCCPTLNTSFFATIHLINSYFFYKANIINNLFLFFIVWNKTKLSPDDKRRSAFRGVFRIFLLNIRRPDIFPLCFFLHFPTKRFHVRFLCCFSS